MSPSHIWCKHLKSTRMAKIREHEPDTTVRRDSFRTQIRHKTVAVSRRYGNPLKQVRKIWIRTSIECDSHGAISGVRDSIVRGEGSTWNEGPHPVKASADDVVLESTIENQGRTAARISWPVCLKHSLVPNLQRVLKSVLAHQFVHQGHDLSHSEGLLQTQQPLPN